MCGYAKVAGPEGALRGRTDAAKEQVVNLKISNAQGVKVETLVVETENPLRLAAEDYHFDGRKDYSVSYIDGGNRHLSVLIG